MINGEKIVDIANNYIGDSGVAFCKEYGLNYVVDWCVIYVWYVFRKAKACSLFYDCQKVCNVGNADSWLRRHAQWVQKISAAKAGDIVIMTWDAGKGNNTRTGTREHIGIVRYADGNKVYTIEGNTGSKYCNKSKVMERIRPAANIYAIYRPMYDSNKLSKQLTSKVKETLSGKYGTGEKRKKLLGKDYNEVQSIVTTVTELTTETLKGYYGNGDTRKKSLGCYYDLVQWNITRLQKEKESKKNVVH